MLAALSVTTVAPATAEAVGAVPAQPAPVHSSFRDPLQGPLTLEEAQHSHDALHLTPATTFTVIPRQTSPGAGHPATGLLVAPATYNQAGLQKEVFGFAPYWTLSQESTWDYSVLSTIAYFGLPLSWDGSWETNSGGWQAFNSQNLTDMINRAHAAGDRVVLSVEGTGQAALNDVLTNAPSKQLALTNIVNAIGYRGVDGVMIDFEGTTGSAYPNIQSGLTDFMTQLSSQVHSKWPQDLVTIATYSGSASWDFGLMKIDALAPVVDAMFVMAYDMSFSNMPGQAGPTAPYSGWTYNDSLSVSQYLTKAPASKIILGVPWYGYKFTTSSNTRYAPESNAVAESYSKVRDYLNCARPTTYWDATARAPWGFWKSPSSNDPCGDNVGKWQEIYWDDTGALANKYALVNSSGIRGMGMWALGYDGGASELWGELSTYFSCPASMNVAGTQSTTEFKVQVSAGSCGVKSFDVQQFDGTLNTGWYSLKPSSPSSGSAQVIVDGFPGSTYQLRARAHSTAGVTSSWSELTVGVDSAASWSHPFHGLYTVDNYGGLHFDNSPPVTGTAYWPGKKLVRAAKSVPGNEQAGLVLDAYGSLHPYGAPTTIVGGPHWTNWDIARDFALLPDGTGGYVLDGFGGLSPFGLNGHAAPPLTKGGPYWRNWDIARKVVIFSDGTGGYVMDAYGGLHGFGINGPAPAPATGGGYWAGNPIARDLVLIPGTHAGYVLEAYGGLHAFNSAAALTSPAYWPGWDIARSVWLLSSSTLTAPAGYLLDGWGGIHQFGGAPAITGNDYWPHWDIAHNLTGS